MWEVVNPNRHYWQTPLQGRISETAESATSWDAEVVKSVCRQRHTARWLHRRVSRCWVCAISESVTNHRETAEQCSLAFQRRLQSVLNAVAGLIFNLWCSDHISDALISLHWLPVPERIQHKNAVLNVHTRSSVALWHAVWDHSSESLVLPVCQDHAHSDQTVFLLYHLLNVNDR